MNESAVLSSAAAAAAAWRPRMDEEAGGAVERWSGDWRLALGIAVATALLVWEQVVYLRRGKHLPGPMAVLPFLGSVIPMVKDPAAFWEAQARAAAHSGLSWNVLLGRFILFVRKSEMSHKIFANVKPEVFQLVGHPFGKKIFGRDNLIFMFGQEHKDLRRRLAPLFTHRALGVYVGIQEKIIRHHIRNWVKESGQGPVQVRHLCRELNLETSQNVFVGPYLTGTAREQFCRDYNDFNLGVMSLPVSLPGFAFYRATHAVPRITTLLADCARQSKERMKQGAEPACLVDFWMADTVRELEEAKVAGRPPPPQTSDAQVGQLIFDFLFAAQDASTSSLAWAVSLLESHPQVLAKVRDEVDSSRRASSLDGSAGAGGFTTDKLRELKYTEMVVKEVLRFRPPATMVPHIATNDFPLTDTYTIPKGTIVFPSLFESSFQGFTDPYTFDPDRFSPERQEDVIFKSNWLMFGAGAHQCIGQRYAINHLILFTALFSSLTDWTRVRTPGCDDLAYTPTIAPKDGCLISLSQRVSP